MKNRLIRLIRLLPHPRQSSSPAPCRIPQIRPSQGVGSLSPPTEQVPAAMASARVRTAIPLTAFSLSAWPVPTTLGEAEVHGGPAELGESPQVVSVTFRQIHFIHDFAGSTDQQSLKCLRETGPRVSRRGAAKEDPVRQSADQNAVWAIVVKD